MRYVSPLRYPGGKGRLATYIKLVFRYNGLLDGHYVEPYAGGAAVALSLLFSEYAAHIHINDISRPLFAFWHSVLNTTDELCELIRSSDVNMGEWHRQKSIQAQASDVSLLELGFSTFFLNRTNRSGILSGGVIGGQSQTGSYRMDARYNKDGLIKRIQRIARYRSRISLHCEDAERFVHTVVHHLPGSALLYLDPPYYVKGKGLYEDHYEHHDHVRVASMLKGLKHRWVISYDSSPEIREMYERYPHIEYDLSYSTADRYRGREIMYFNRNVVIPPVSDPSRNTDRALRRILRDGLLP